MQICDASVKYKFVGGAFHTQKSIFQEIENEGIFVPNEDYFYCFRAAFDYESYFCKENLPPNGPQLEWLSDHISISVNVGSNIQGFLENKCFVSNRNVEQLVSCKIQEQFRYVFVALELLRDTRLAAEPNSSKEKLPLTRLMNRFDAFLSDQEQAVQAINNPLFNSLHPITKNLFDVQSFKKKIVFDLPFQIVFLSMDTPN